ncbi:MAG TPA: hypothetical protein VG122_14305, partial [Gemmata sp.]|nr:hypothetical protein [Gemmata sp.]
AVQTSSATLSNKGGSRTVECHQPNTCNVSYKAFGILTIFENTLLRFAAISVFVRGNSNSRHLRRIQKATQVLK